MGKSRENRGQQGEDMPEGMGRKGGVQHLSAQNRPLTSFLCPNGRMHCLSVLA